MPCIIYRILFSFFFVFNFNFILNVCALKKKPTNICTTLWKGFSFIWCLWLRFCIRIGGVLNERKLEIPKPIIFGQFHLPQFEHLLCKWCNWSLMLWKQTKQNEMFKAHSWFRFRFVIKWNALEVAPVNSHITTILLTVY